MATLAKPKDIEIVELSTLGLRSLDAEALAERERLIAEHKYDAEAFRLARQFRDADEIIIAAPYWDLSFPSLLKTYFEHICVSGLTFGYTEKGSEGYCRATELLYFSTCGGFIGEQHLGFTYVESLGRMLGIDNCRAYTIEGLDIDPSKREHLLAQAIRQLNEQLTDGTE